MNVFTTVLGSRRGDSPVDRLLALDERSPRKTSFGGVTQFESELALFKTPLGKAGFTTPALQKRAKLGRSILIGGGAIGGILIGLASGKPPIIFFALLLCGYLGLVTWMLILRQLEKRFEQQILFSAPIVLESIILLVESGLGVLPAIERVIKQEKRNPVLQLLRIVYEYTSAGIPFGEALESVADGSDQRLIRHIFLHLDISGNEGGELIPSLRSLSNFAQTEWKLSVEERVKRLENLVVFPVFISVIGLMLLTAAVPLVPVLELREQLRNAKKPVTTENISQGR